jgi:hypothetical protein
MRLGGGGIEFCYLDTPKRSHEALRSLTALLDQFRHEPGPPRLVAGPHASSGVAVKIFVEWNVVAPVPILLKLLIVAKHSSSSGRIA